MLNAYSEADADASEDVPLSNFDSPTYVPDTITRCLESSVQVENVTTCVALEISTPVLYSDSVWTFFAYSRSPARLLKLNVKVLLIGSVI